MMGEKFDFIGKNDNEEITHEFFESTTISKSLKEKKKVNILMKKHSVFTSKFKLLYLKGLKVFLLFYEVILFLTKEKKTKLIY